jgi:hypothetical protein
VGSSIQPGIGAPTYEVFFVLESFQVCFAEYVSALGPLTEHGLRILGCDAYYRQDTDVALLALRFDERVLDGDGLEWLLDFASGAGLAALDPARLPEADRRRFYQRYLGEYPLRAENKATAEDTLHALAEALGLRVPRPRVLTTMVVRTHAPDAASASAHVRLPTADVPTDRRQHAPSSPPVARLATQPPAAPQGKARTTGRPRAQTVNDWPGGSPPRRLPDSPTVGSDPFALAEPARAPVSEPLPVQPAPAPRRVIDLPTDPMVTLPAELAAPTTAATAAPGVSHRPPSTPPPVPHDARPADRLRPGSEPMRRPNAEASVQVAPPRPTRASNRPPGVACAPPRMSSPPPDGDAPTIHTRFRRGDDWVPARVRSLSLKGAFLACGAPPRLQDDVHVAFGLDRLGTVMRGTVAHVTSAEDAQSGACGFGVLFPAFDSPARRQLLDLLREARSQGIVLTPPPPRRHVRFPVRWPAHFILPNHRGVSLPVLDVSNSGLFVATLESLPSTTLEFYLPTEQPDTPIHGCARVVRQVPWSMACARGLSSGFGLEILDFSGVDCARFDNFVARVGRRVQRRIVVGASQARTEELVTALAAAGYTVTGSSDPNAIIKLAECEPRPPDAAVIDSSLPLQLPTMRRLEQLLATREVPMISIAGEPPARARAVVDDLLRVCA